ncbi:MAG: YafY family transcriptional regulator [Chloroflexi bacterium]|nr:YafY family transcriptional regulator [Chloroflexota bacterium]
MRADRLLSELLLLQAHGKMAAQDLAETLEVSVRTIYRDIDALSTAGVPVYAERGPGGGCALLDNYKTNLTGLTENELRALFMLSIPAPLSDLGMMESLATALRKFSAALPDQRRQQQAWIQQRIHLDWAWWRRSVEPVPHLQTIQQAVWEDRRLLLRYQMQLGPTLGELERVVKPYGLVAKAGVWYLVCFGDQRLRVHRVSQLVDVSLLESTFERVQDFDLSAFWAAWCERREEKQGLYPVAIRVSPALMPYLPQFFGEQVRTGVSTFPSPDNEGWTSLTLPFTSLESARARLLGFGGAIEVVEPEALRRSIADYAQQIVNRYSA